MSLKLAKQFKHFLTHLAPDINQMCLDTLWQSIHDHYTQSHRHYHTLTHVEQIFTLLDDHKPKLYCPNAVALAIWYHDIIYDPTKSDNERQSANYFKLTYVKYLPEPLIKEVETLIMMTVKHQLDKTDNEQVLHDAKYFLDMDLAILGRDWLEYERYTQQVRLEYQHVPLPDYKKGRTAILHSFLRRERLYFTTEFFERFDAKARDNIKREIEVLDI